MRLREIFSNNKDLRDEIEEGKEEIEEIKRRTTCMDKLLDEQYERAEEILKANHFSKIVSKRWEKQ